MSNCKTPDVLIGLGGGGGRIIYRFLNQDWLLSEVFESPPDDQGGPDQLHATVIDTAVGEKWHRKRAHEVRDKIQHTLRRHDRHADEHLRFDGPEFLPELVPDHWLEPEQLTNTYAIQELCRSDGLTSWWLSEAMLGHAPTDGFEHGVYRNRSLAKALYHIANYTTSGIGPATTQTDDVAIVTALGGGTGSGMALDFATDIDSHRTHLYAVLPHRGASDREQANAYAALSELEYTQLAGESPFDTITLIPHLQDVAASDFEMAAVRTILAHQNTIQAGQGSRQFVPGGPQGPPDYAPFTVAMPHTVEYPISLHDEAEEQLHQLLSTRQRELRLEADLYAAVETYLQESFPATAGEILDHPTSEIEPDESVIEEASRLRQRIEQDLRETMLEDETFNLLGLESELRDVRTLIDNCLESIYDHLDDAQAIEEDEVSYQFLQTAPEPLVEMLEHGHEVQGLPAEVVDSVVTELENIALRRDLFDAVSQITSEQTDLDPDEASLIRSALREGILDGETKWMIAAVPSIDGKIAELDDKKAHLENVSDELRNFHDEVTDAVWNHVHAWASENTEPARILTAINEHGQDVFELLDSLQKKIRDSIKRLEEADTAAETRTVALDLHRFEEANRLLDEMGIPTIPLREIEDMFDQHVREARIIHLEYGDGLLNGLLDLGPDPEEYARHRAAIDDSEWFDIEPEVVDGGEFACTFSSDRLPVQSRNEIEAYKHESVSELVESLVSRFDPDGGGVQFERTIGEATTITIPSDAEDGLDRISKELHTTLEESEAEHPDALFSDVIPELVDDIDVRDTAAGPTERPIRRIFGLYRQPIRDHFDKITTRRKTVEDSLDRLTELRELEELGSEFAYECDGRFEINSKGNFEIDTAGNPYVNRYPPTPEQLIDYPRDIGDTQVLESQEQSISHEFRRFVTDLFGGDKRASVASFEPSGTGGVGAPSYDGLRFYPVYLSRAIDNPGLDVHGPLRSIDDAVYGELANRRTDMNTRNVYTADAFATGGLDEISMVLFVTGHFLDNIAPVTDSGGYYDAYRTQNDRTHVATRHSIGLGGNWDQWNTLRAWTETSLDESDSRDRRGAYLFRDTVRSVDDGELLDAVMEAEQTDGTDPSEVFLDMYEFDTYESTVSFD